jgi:hypothetical protein
MQAIQFNSHGKASGAAGHVGGSNGLMTVRVAKGAEAKVGRWRDQWETANLNRRGANEGAPMCDYSLQNVKTRPAKVGDKLITHRFGSGTIGFSALEDIGVAVCVLPGTELSFAYDVKRSRMWPWSRNIIAHKVAVFRQVNQD